MKFLLALFALFFGTALQAQVPYTLTLADGTTTVASPHRAGLNLASLNYYDNGQLYKNLVGQDNFGFENTLTQQIWALTAAGTTTTFCNTNKYAVYPVNFWTGATVSVVESSGAEAGYVGTVASNTAGGPACYTVATAAPAAFAAGDEIIVTLNQFPTAESCWETSTNCGIWTNIQNGGKLLTDSTTPYDGKQSLILDATAAASSVAGVNLYFDSDSQNHFVVLNGAYEITGWMKTGAAAMNHVLTVCAGRISNQQCKNVTPTSTWTQFSISISLAENSTTQNAALVSAYITGSNGLGQVEIDDLSFTKTSGQDPTNTSVFRDEFVAALRQYCATETTGPSCLIRNWTNQNGETMATWTSTQSAATQTIATAGAITHGEITPRLLDYLNLVKLVGGVPYFVEPVTFQGSDPANLVEYLASTNTGSGYGQIRANQGQSAPWVGTNGVFSDVYISFCNECWNDSSFSGQALPWRSAQANDYYHDYWNRAKDVFAPMRADSAFTPNIHLGFNLQLGVNYAPGGLDKALGGMAAVGGAADFVEQAPYEQSVVSSWSTDALLWNSAMEQPWDDANSSGYNKAVMAIQSYKLCGQTGTAACFATDYEQANNTLATCGVAGWAACDGTTSFAIDQTHEDRINAGAGEGIIAPLQVALNQSRLGVTVQNYFGATEFSNGTLYGMTATNSKLWGICVDYGGATSYANGQSYNCRPQFLGMSILNQAIIGPEYSCAFASGPSYSWPGSINGPTSAAASVPYVHPFCFKGGADNSSQRSIVLFNTDLTNSYTIAFSGSGLPTGTCSQQQYAPSSPDLLNEAASGTNTATATITTQIASSSVSCGSTITLPPDSETAITYTVNGTPQTSTPSLSVASGTYATTQSVTISDSTSGASIYYTLDGSAPTTSSNLYSGAITVSSSETLNTVALASGYSVSAAASATYTITTATATPTFSVATGSYTTAQSVAIVDATSGAKIYYTLDGSTPTTSSTLYSGAITVGSTETISAVAIASGYSVSSAASATYTITTATATPTFSIAGGSYTTAQTVTIADSTSGAKIYFTLNGSTPSTSSTLYSGAISVGSSETINAVAIASGYSISSTTSATYTITLASKPAITAPVFSLGAGTYPAAQMVSISAASTSQIHYTVDGSMPTAASQMYASAMAVKATETLRAVAVSGTTSSNVTSATYVISTSSGTAATPVMAQPAGVYTKALNVQIGTTTAGAVIHYTVDGSTPTASSPAYNGFVAVTKTVTIKAMAIKSGMAYSPIATAIYTINARAAIPTFSKTSGSYKGAQTETITDTTPGAVIYYTTDQSTPTAASKVYTGAFTVSGSEYVQAIAIAPSFTTSFIGAANLNITR